jgi:ferritin-like metal-binding protein YciE
MSLHTKLELHQRQLKALLEEHTALVESRLATIESVVRGEQPEDAESGREAYDTLLERLTEVEKENDTLKDLSRVLRNGHDTLKEENYSLRATLEAVTYETGNKITKLEDELEAARSQQRYHGCYNITGRRSRVRDVSAIFMILGGHHRLAELLDCQPGSISHWREGNFFPLHHKEKIDELLSERGYTADSLLFRKTREPKGE